MDQRETALAVELPKDGWILDIVDAYPVVVTDRMRACRDFYTRWFGFEVAFEATWFVLLTYAGVRPVSLAFMATDHPSAPPSPAPHDGNGSFLTLQVSDAQAEYERLTGAGLQFDLALTDEPWGQRQFGLLDPAGMWVDVVEQIEPRAGWWDRYQESTEP